MARRINVTPPKWSKERMAALLTTNNRAVERAVLVIYGRQTRDEQLTSDTRHHNRMGFTAAHAHRGSYFARWILGGKNLSGHHLVAARKMMLHYLAQLTHVANERSEANANAQEV